MDRHQLTSEIQPLIVNYIGESCRLKEHGNKKTKTNRRTHQEKF